MKTSASQFIIQLKCNKMLISDLIYSCSESVSAEEVFVGIWCRSIISSILSVSYDSVFVCGIV